MTAYEVVEAVVNGVRVVALVPLGAESPAEQLALRVRASATATGRCVCGAVAEFAEKRDGVVHLVMAHEHDCPAVSAAAEHAIKRTGGQE